MRRTTFLKLLPAALLAPGVLRSMFRVPTELPPGVEMKAPDGVWTMYQRWRESPDRKPGDTWTTEGVPAVIWPQNTTVRVLRSHTVRRIVLILAAVMLIPLACADPAAPGPLAPVAAERATRDEPVVCILYEDGTEVCGPAVPPCEPEIEDCRDA